MHAQVFVFVVVPMDEERGSSSPRLVFFYGAPPTENCVDRGNAQSLALIRCERERGGRCIRERLRGTLSILHGDSKDALGTSGHTQRRFLSFFVLDEEEGDSPSPRLAPFDVPPRTRITLS